jgi:hypothetical protein
MDRAGLTLHRDNPEVIKMANEIYADYASGNTLYAITRDGTGRVWWMTGQAFEDWGTGGHTASNYALPLTDKGGSRYVGDFDTDVPAGRYRVQLFVQAGASPADGDAIVASRDIAWTGKGELTALTILANKAIQDTAAETIDYYDNDNQTVVLTHRVHDVASGSIRTID